LEEAVSSAEEEQDAQEIADEVPEDQPQISRQVVMQSIALQATALPLNGNIYFVAHSLGKMPLQSFDRGS
jgi:hypothetical protein